MSCPSIGRVSLRAPLAAPRRAAPAPAVRGAALRVRAAGNIVETAASGAAGNFTKLLAAATAAGLADTLSGPGPFTVFAVRARSARDPLVACGADAQGPRSRRTRRSLRCRPAPWMAC